MHNFLRAAAAAPDTKTADIRHNTEEIINMAKNAAQRGAQVLVLPEAALTGGDLGSLLENRHFLELADRSMQKIAAETAGLDLLIVTCSGYIYGGTVTDHGKGSAAMVFISASRQTCAGEWKKLRDTLKALSSVNKSAYVYAGSGLLICENGRVLAEREALRGGETMIIADIDCDELRRAEIPDDTPGVKFGKANEDLLRNVQRNPFFPEDTAEYPAFCEEILTIQKTALARRIAHVTAKKAVINLSGGLDSAVALLACAGAMDMLGRDRADILALSLPGFGTSLRTAKNSRLLAEGIGASFKKTDIKPVCAQILKDAGIGEDDRSTAFENVQARHRTQLALNIANAEDGIMIGTGNMSEAALGFTTFGGDALSMYNPNIGLTKTAARELAKYAADCKMFGAEVSAVLLDILQTPVSPELLPPADGEFQETENIVGPYELTDFFLYYFLKNYPPGKIAFLAQAAFKGKYSGKVIVKWLNSFHRRFFAGQFKRHGAAEGPAVLGVSLSAHEKFGYSLPGDVSGGGAEMFVID